MEYTINNEKINDFLLSKGLLKSILTQKLITPKEYEKCLKDLEKHYLT